MAAVTPDSVKRVNMGGVTAYIADFSGVSSGDTWDSGISNIAYIAPTQKEAAGTQASTGIGASYDGSEITILLGEDDKDVKLLILTGAIY